ncbi:hypothetical protein ACHAW5_008316 [Stephanodiscus triporus]|uniref:SAP domain-containing protein n=1 Tax=Stephanodiscus triporus TaxID=2934178 RepID=A0ABD3QDH7_9STRA
MKRKADCPHCHAAVRMPGSTDYERGIVPDKQLEQRVDAYKRCRDRLRERLVRLDVLEKERALGMPTTREDDDGGAGAGRRPESRGGRERGMARMDLGDDIPSPKRARKATAQDVYCSHADESGSDDDDDDDDGDYDDAPNSNVSHDRAAAERAPPPPPQQNQPLKRKATVSYHTMNRKKLVDICRGEGLSTHGNEAELKQRHSDYITLYNSECDSEHPRSVKELLNEIKSREISIKREAEQSGPKQQRVLIKHLADSLEAYNGGSIGRLTTSNAAFDAKLNNKYAELIASVKKREGRSSSAKARVPAVQNDSLERKSSSVDDEKSAIREGGEGQTAVTSSRQQTSGVSDLGGMDNEAVSPSISTDSDKTVEAPRKIREANHEETYSPSASIYNTTGKRASSRKSTSSKKSDSHSAVAMTFATTSSARISSLGPWICNACTFENLRNITRNSRCEMCDTVRPKESEPDHHRKARDVEIVNIDC